MAMGDEEQAEFEGAIPGPGRDLCAGCRSEHRLPGAATKTSGEVVRRFARPLNGKLVEKSVPTLTLLASSPTGRRASCQSMAAQTFLLVSQVTEATTQGERRWLAKTLGRILISYKLLGKCIRLDVSRIRVISQGKIIPGEKQCPSGLNSTVWLNRCIPGSYGQSKPLIPAPGPLSL